MATKNIFSIDIDVRFRDLDAMGHVNNAVMFTYFEIGRTEFFLGQLASDAPPNFNFILAHIRCDYLLPVMLEDRPALHIWIDNIGSKSFQLVYELADRADAARVFARGASIQVCYDYQEGRSVELPAAFKEQLGQYLPA